MEYYTSTPPFVINKKIKIKKKIDEKNIVRRFYRSDRQYQFRGII